MKHFERHAQVNSKLLYGSKAKSDVTLTIVVPTYRRYDMLSQALQSICDQIQPQRITYQVIIISNDPDFVISMVSANINPAIFSVYCNETNIGMVGNMNRCAVIAQGEYIAYLQDDDLLTKDFLITFEELYLSGQLETVDCLIPNRYYYYNYSDNGGLFGAKAIKKEKTKKLLMKLLSIGKQRPLFQQVRAVDCAKIWYNGFGGGPTCGIVFKRKSLLSTEGFSEDYPYAFDFVFFVVFSNNHRVCLYNKTLSIYRMVESASNRPDVQVDFYRADMYLLEQTRKRSKFVRFFEEEIREFSLRNKSEEAQKMLIDNEGRKINIPKYYLFRIIRFMMLLRSQLYRRELCMDGTVDTLIARGDVQ